METVHLLSDLAARGVRIRRVGGRLRLMPKSALTAELVDRAKQCKAELIADSATVEAFGTVNPGWTPTAWAVRLRQLAARCERVVPDRAAFLRAWATALDERHRLTAERSHNEAL